MIALNFYHGHTPLQLLEIQQMCAEKLLDSLASPEAIEAAISIREAVNLELVARGRCTLCGLKHTIMDCHRLTGKALE